MCSFDTNNNSKMFLLFALSYSKLYTTSFEEKSFLSWMRSTNIIYTGDEYHLRYGIFLTNYRYNQEFNRHSKSYKIGLNKFTCLTPQEAKAMLGLTQTRTDFSHPKTAPKINLKQDIPKNLDWREKGAVYDVEDQGSCGSCWAFSVIQAQESAHAIATGQLLGLSQSTLIDCVGGDCHGCHGGWPDKAFRYIIDNLNGQFNLLSEYPYIGVEQNCQFSQHERVSKVSDVQRLPEGDEENMKNHLATVGPVSICVDSSSYTFYSYTSGIYDEESCMKHIFNHAMGVVGYGYDETSSRPYWIVRNSWGQNWGQDGYVKFLMGVDLCSIADYVTYPIL